MTVFFSFMVAYFAVLIIPFWADKLGNGLSGKGMLITGLVSFLGAFLFQLFAPESMFYPAILIGVGITAFTLIIFWIFGR